MVSEVIIRSLKLSDLAQKGFDANFGENKQINYDALAVSGFRLRFRVLVKVSGFG